MSDIFDGISVFCSSILIHDPECFAVTYFLCCLINVCVNIPSVAAWNAAVFAGTISAKARIGGLLLACKFLRTNNERNEGLVERIDEVPPAALHGNRPFKFLTRVFTSLCMTAPLIGISENNLVHAKCLRGLTQWLACIQRRILIATVVFLLSHQRRHPAVAL